MAAAQARRIARGNQEAVHPVGHQIEISRRGRRDHGLAERHRFEQRLGESLHPAGQQHQLQQLVKRAHVGDEGQHHHGMPRRHPLGGFGQRLVLARAGQHQADRGPDLRQRREHDRLVLSPAHDAERAPPRLPADAGAPFLDRARCHGAVHPLRHQPVGNHRQLPPRRAPAHQRLGDRRADGDDARRDPARDPVLQEHRPGHLPPGGDERNR